MSDLFWLTDAQTARLESCFPKSHGKPRIDDRRGLGGGVFINRNGLRWRGAPETYGSHKTLYSRWKRWSEKGIFARMMVGLAAKKGDEPLRHRSERQWRMPPGRSYQGRHEHQAARNL